MATIYTHAGSNIRKTWILMTGFLILIIVFLYQYIKFKRFYFFMVLIVLGGIGNMFNRVIWGSVWDYICLPFVPFCFNLSDLLISFGVLSYILGINGNRDSLRRQ